MTFSMVGAVCQSSCAVSGSCAAAHMLRVSQGPAFVCAQIGRAVHSAAIVALWQLLGMETRHMRTGSPAFECSIAGTVS